MKKAVLVVLSIVLTISLAACTNDGSAESPGAASQTASQTASLSQQTQDMSYAFEFEDIDGKVHKLFDYSGKPVYLEVWGSWCGVCVSSLPEMNEFAGEEHDFAVLSVITPNAAGEKSKEDFIKWYKELGYDNLVVLIDEKQQIVSDFGVSAYPSQIMFDSEGNFVDGFIGLLPKEKIIEVMGKIAEGTYND